MWYLGFEEKLLKVSILNFVYIENIEVEDLVVVYRISQFKIQEQDLNLGRKFVESYFFYIYSFDLVEFYF